MNPFVIFLGLSTTVLPPSFELHITATKELVKPWPQTWEECDARAKASLGEWTCVMRQKYTTVITCDDVPKPTAPPQNELWAVQDPIDDNLWHNYVPGWVKATTPVDSEAACWQLGQVELVYDPEAPTDEPVHEPVCHKDVYPDECPKP